MATRLKSVYDEVVRFLKHAKEKHHREDYKKYKRLNAAMDEARQNQDPVAFHHHRVELLRLRARVLGLIAKERSSKRAQAAAAAAASSAGNKDAGALSTEIEAMRREYERLRVAQYNAAQRGDTTKAREYKSRADPIRAKVAELRVRLNSVTSINDGQPQPAAAGSSLLNSSEDNGIAANGSEPAFTPKLWGTAKGKGNNNCYSYAMNNFSANRPRKAVPGDRSGYDHDLDYKSCRQIKERLLQDNPDSIYPEKPENLCRPGFSKIMMFVGEREIKAAYGDFHFYKHHKDIEYEVQPGDDADKVAAFLQTTRDTVVAANGGKPALAPGSTLVFKDFRTINGESLWSHKLGWATGALLTDACGKVITDPRLSCRKFSTIDYKKYCGTYCIRNDIAKSS
jgi:hypothetical protein